jgi:hypothetical protein
MKNILIASRISVAAAISLSIGCALINLEDEIMQTKPIPMRQKLADIADNQVTASVIWPNAEPWSYQLVIGLPQGTISDPSSNRRCPDFAAIVSIIGPNDIVVQRFSITSDDTMECNWLDAQHDLDGVIVTWKRTDLFRSCKPGKRYTVRLDFERRSKELNSFWI